MDAIPLPAKAPEPILVIVSGKSIDFKLLQPANAHTPILVTEFGIETEDNPLQPPNMDIADYQLFVVNTVEK